MTFLDRYGMVQKSRPILDTLGRSLGPPIGLYLSTLQLMLPILDTLGRSLGPPIGLYLSTLQLILPTTILDEYTGGTRPRMDPGPGDGWLP
jgi:hypothetical protein